VQRESGSRVFAAMSIDWEALAGGLWERGFATTHRILEVKVCEALVAAYDDDSRYRSTVRMQAHGFGRGEYRYYAYPLPRAVEDLRERLYTGLAPIANAWNEALGSPERYPATLDEYLERCRAGGQGRPTTLILTYGSGDFNCLHQDVYGELAFPLQATVYLSDRAEYEGGESVFVMQRPRAQSRAAVVAGDRGDLLVFANRYRPVPSVRGFARENVRHGIAEVRGGRRFALGIIFHDAR
jgi:hypothetical protein